MGPISRVAVVSTGSVRLRPEHIGPTWKPMPLWMLMSTRWTEPRPINVFVVEHRDGLVLFDTGQDRASLTDAGYYPGRLDRLVNARLGRLRLGCDETLDAGLSRLGYRLADVRIVVLSHLHQDHVGGLSVLRHATIMVSRDEWTALNRPLPQLRGMYRSHIDLPGLTWKVIVPEPLGAAHLEPFTGGYDIFADGSMVIIPTPGHTPGSVSMLVRRPGLAPLLMVGDLTYDAAHLTSGTPSGMCAKKPTRASMNKVNALRRTFPDIVVLPAHDPRAARQLGIRPRTDDG